MITTTPTEVKKISREQLRSVIFQNSVGYFTDCELRDQNRKLHLSILLANHADADVRIVFNTIDGYRELRAAIWGATEKFVLVKGGSFIPVECVAYVSLAA